MGRVGAGPARERANAFSRSPLMPRMVNRYRRWRERSQADRGFDGEPPLHAGHFGLGMRHWDAQYPPGSPKPPGKSSPPADRIGYAGQFASPGYPDALRTDRRR